MARRPKPAAGAIGSAKRPFDPGTDPHATRKSLAAAPPVKREPGMAPETARPQATDASDRKPAA